MRKLNEEETLKIVGGINITSALLNSLSKVADSILEAGRSLGSAIRRFVSRDLCSCK